ncbi:MAG: YdcF family protein [Oscillospiraceae bacterium]|nr:YdcF family protein [Oscillospiraceae bacterium]
MVCKRVFIITGAVCVLYGAAVLSVIGIAAVFNWFYLFLGLFLIVLGKVLGSKNGKGENTARAVCIVASACLAVFLLTEAAIIGVSMRDPMPDADYVILLGTQLKDDGPSVDFRARILSAYRYLEENPGSMLIATGGKGTDEPVSEAEGARIYLVGLGIPEDRILAEDKSRNTRQNIENAFALIKERGEDPEECRIVIVSASYHLMRACYIAYRTGFSNISSRGSTGNILLLPHFYTREFFALVKDVVKYLFHE